MALQTRIAYLPPMSGLAANELRLDEGAINVRIGEGRTAEVLRNLCFQAAAESSEAIWEGIRDQVKVLFGVTLDKPLYVTERGEIQMTYTERDGTKLDLSSSGRGLQQTLLLLTYLALHPGSVLLLDEPDAHLELLRQREMYQTLTAAAKQSGSQIIIASHSEEVLNEAAGSGDSVVAFLGKPHPIPHRRAGTLRKSLDAIRFDQYYEAEQRGWALYLEDRTDLSILRAFAKRLNHPVHQALQTPFLVPIGNQPNRGREHFNALLEAKPDLRGFLLVDRDAGDLQQREELVEKKWERREIENYLCQPATLLAFAHQLGQQRAYGPLFEQAGAESAVEVMERCMADRVVPAALRDTSDPWWTNVKASDDLLDIVFPDFFRRLGLRVEFRKADYHELVAHIADADLVPEIAQVLDRIHEVASRSHPAE